MELRAWALQILSAETIEGKLLAPVELTDQAPGAPLFWKEPARPVGMGFTKHKKEDKLPALHDLHHPDLRAVCLHRFAGHELLAVEIMAFTLLAFPDAPPRFRLGVAYTLKEEQQHVRLYMEQMERLGVKFGDLPLYRHFWKHTPYIQSPQHYVSMMSLTFEMANLDFAPMYGQSFARFGDTQAAGLMAKIVEDEIRHVRFGWRWLTKFAKVDPAEGKTSWAAWEETLASTLLHPKRARGFFLQEAPRREAGIPQEWIAQLKNYP